MYAAVVFIIYALQNWSINRRRFPQIPGVQIGHSNILNVDIKFFCIFWIFSGVKIDAIVLRALFRVADTSNWDFTYFLKYLFCVS